MNRLSRLAALVLAAFVLLPLGAAAQEEGPAAGTVIVVVHGPGGAAVADARVTLEEAGDTSYSREATTDAQGSVTLQDVPLGAVAAKAFDADGQLLASGVGYLERAGEVITLIIGLEPAE